MDLFLDEIVHNKVLWTAIVSWFIAQSLKVVLTMYVDREFKLERFHGSGGMPSSHTATIVAASTAIGLIEGWGTSVYALSMIMSFIVMYDASGVRRSVGKQAKLLNGILLDLYKHKHLEEDKLKELVGHKPTEVAVGAILGVIVANLLV